MAKLSLLVQLTVIAAAASFQQPRTVLRAPLNILPKRQHATSVLMQARKQSREAIAEANGYWQGEWICADCGYIYDPSLFNGMFFEEQTKGFKCPQCSGPRRRYAKKVGDTVGVTLDGGDGPILAASFIGIILTFALGFYFTVRLIRVYPYIFPQLICFFKTDAC